MAAQNIRLCTQQTNLIETRNCIWMLLVRLRDDKPEYFPYLHTKSIRKIVPRWAMICYCASENSENLRFENLFPMKYQLSSLSNIFCRLFCGRLQRNNFAKLDWNSEYVVFILSLVLSGAKCVWYLICLLLRKSFIFSCQKSENKNTNFFSFYVCMKK